MAAVGQGGTGAAAGALGLYLRAGTERLGWEKPNTGSGDTFPSLEQLVPVGLIVSQFDRFTVGSFVAGVEAVA